jgi:hypothetical protein
MARACIFCGATADSVEDAWPKWLTSRFIAPGTMESQRGADLRLNTWRTDRPKIGVKRACTTCNNEWMSRLQLRAKPIIERLWGQNARILDIEDSRTLSLWTVMTAMVLQTLGEPEAWLFSDLERTLFWKCEHMPQMTGVWIANCLGHSEVYSQSRSMWTGPSRDAEQQDRGNVITMAFGSLAIQLLKLVPHREVAPGTEVTVAQGPGPWEEVSRQIWPIQPEPVSWPPSSGIRSEYELDLFAERFCPQNPAAS